ncbi:MAG TPA: hypothetical protein VJZ26_05835 [Blastocatellia bacterium]|nr:hypothetical protein [Blastocatellia bacterium]
MTTANLDRVIEEVKALTRGEQKQLRDMLDALLASAAPQMTEEEFERRLLEKGIISSIPSRITDPASFKSRERIKLEGKPVSEIIVEERR